MRKRTFPDLTLRGRVIVKKNRNDFFEALKEKLDQAAKAAQKFRRDHPDAPPQLVLIGDDGDTDMMEVKEFADHVKTK